MSGPSLPSKSIMKLFSKQNKEQKLGLRDRGGNQADESIARESSSVSHIQTSETGKTPKSQEFEALT